MNKSERGVKRYFIELSAVMLLLMALLIGRNWAPTGEIRAALQLASLIPIWLIGLVVVRGYRASDEYHRQQILLIFAIGGGATALLIMSYLQVQKIGLPAISIIWVWPIMGALCGLCAMVLSLRDSVSLIGTAKTLKWAGAMAAIITLPTVLYALVAPALGWPHKTGLLVLIATMIFMALNAYYMFVRRRCE